MVWTTLYYILFGLMSLLVGLILTALNGPVGTESRGVAVFTHRDSAPLNKPTFTFITLCYGRLCNWSGEKSFPTVGFGFPWMMQVRCASLFSPECTRSVSSSISGGSENELKHFSYHLFLFTYSYAQDLLDQRGSKWSLFQKGTKCNFIIFLFNIKKKEEKMLVLQMI